MINVIFSIRWKKSRVEKILYIELAYETRPSKL